ncbi:MAG: UDP-N-acetylglucosamine 1-carboxyvinyltransferase [Cyanobacteriota bacterium]
MKDKIIIKGGKPLTGEVTIGGAKNAVLKIMAAALLVDGICEINNVPELTDVHTMTEVLKHLGPNVEFSKGRMVIDSSTLSNFVAPYDFVSKMRASFIVLGPLLARCGQAKVALPGGCAIGERRIDLHVKGLQALGAEVSINHGYVEAKASKLTGTEIHLDRPSVGATENLMLAATLAEGSTVLINAAQEPEIVDLANFINSIGGDVTGAGTSEIFINGVRPSDLHSTSYTTIPDRIEAGTFMCAALATRGDIIINRVFPTHLGAIMSKMASMGANIRILDPFTIKIGCPERPKAVDIVTQPYPGLPTDMQAPFTSLLAISKGVSIVTESIYENRFRQLGELRRMGANVQHEGNHAIIKGVSELTGTQVKVSDLRAGASLLIAGLTAKGQTEITDLHHIDRGYEHVVKKFQGVGADISRVITLDDGITFVPEQLRL